MNNYMLKAEKCVEVTLKQLTQ